VPSEANFVFMVVGPEAKALAMICCNGRDCAALGGWDSRKRSAFRLGRRKKMTSVVGMGGVI